MHVLKAKEQDFAASYHHNNMTKIAETLKHHPHADTS